MNIMNMTSAGEASRSLLPVTSGESAPGIGRIDQRFVALHCCVCVCVGIDIPLPRTLMMSSGSVSPGSGRACRRRAGSSGGARRKVHPEDA